MEFNYGRQGESSNGIDSIGKTLNEYRVEPLSPDYRDLPIAQGFEWPKIIDNAASKLRPDCNQLYLVVFRSMRKHGIGEARVSQLDEAAHAEAKQSDALLHYFAGPIDEERRAMSWCLWTEKTAACQALSGPAHQEAVGQAHELYDTFAVELYDVLLLAGREAIFAPLRHNH